MSLGVLMDKLPESVLFFTRTRRVMTPLYRALSKIESRLLRSRLKRIDIIKPIYITGLPRSGTTILLEMLAQHPAAASHRNYQYVQPYLPYWLDRIYPLVPLGEDRPFERVHKDKLTVTRTSPDVVEEIFWATFFPSIHDESGSSVLDEKTRHPDFERFYRNHIKKMLLSRGACRYLAKNNYNFSRTGYLSKLFPDARFVFVIRDPVHHVASYLKQDLLFNKLNDEDPRWQDYLCGLGHREFGPARSIINLGDDGLVKQISEAWRAGQVVQACARYWNAVYLDIDARLRADKDLAARSLVLRYEDLCRDSANQIDRLLECCELDPEPFAKTKARYMQRLVEPTYYRPDFNDSELSMIAELTGPAAERYGYAG